MVYRAVFWGIVGFPHHLPPAGHAVGPDYAFPVTQAVPPSLQTLLARGQRAVAAQALSATGMAGLVRPARCVVVGGHVWRTHPASRGNGTVDWTKLLLSWELQNQNVIPSRAGRVLFVRKHFKATPNCGGARDADRAWVWAKRLAIGGGGADKARVCCAPRHSTSPRPFVSYSGLHALALE